MTDYRGLERRLVAALALRRRPVAVAFCDSVPSGVAKFEGTEPSGCSFWRLAAGGRAFYTVPGDHYNCVIGSHTHAITLPPERAAELEQTLGFMAGLGYLRMAEVPGIPRLARTPAAIVYAPLADTPLDPDVALLAARPVHAMLLQEAATRAGVDVTAPLFGRPTCAALPASLGAGVVASAGCVGNRVYTDVGDDEMYVAVPGHDLPRVTDALDTIIAANAALGDYHRGRRRTLASE